jgi:hypothetical protein
LAFCRDADLAARGIPARAIATRSRIRSIAFDRTGERDPHHIDDTNSGDVLAHTGAMTLDESEGRKKLRNSLLARHVTANLLQKRIIQKHA